MANKTAKQEDLRMTDLYEQLKVEIYTELQSLIDICIMGHGDKHLLWSIRKARHELLKSLSDRSGAEYPAQLEWLTDEERAIPLPSRRSP